MLEGDSEGGDSEEARLGCTSSAAFRNTRRDLPAQLVDALTAQIYGMTMHDF